MFKRGIKILCILTLMGTVVYPAVPSVSDEFSDRRLTAGARIFRALLAADVDIEQKAAPSGNLGICLLYADDPKGANVALQTLENRNDARIRNRNIRISIIRFEDGLTCTAKAFAGIFLTEFLTNSQIEQVIRCANRNHIIVFSPLEGDVERGVASGISVEAKVRPYLNMSALQAADIHLKPFFIKVAKTHEP